MAGGKRKRKRSTRQAGRDGSSTATAVRNEPVPAPRGVEATRSRADADGGKGAMTRGYARSEEKNQAVRESLEEIAPGELPKVVIFAVVWLVLMAANFVYGAITVESTTGEQSNVVGRIQNIGLVLMTLLAAWGTLRLKYWALLGTQTLIAIAIVMLTLFALTTKVIWLIPLSLVIVGLSGWLFLRLVKVMARVQVTERIARGESR